MKPVRVYLVTGLLTLFTSCTGQSDQPNPIAASDRPENRQTPSGPVILTAQQLPPLGSTLPPLDDRRVELAPPAEWTVLSRKAGFLARFYRTRPNDMPQILVTVGPAAGAGISTVTPETLDTLVSLTNADVEAKLVGNEKLLEPVTAMIIADQPWVRYIRAGHLKRIVDGQTVTSSLQRVVLATLVGGRLYSIELQAYAATGNQYQDDVYAVAAGMRFLGSPATSDASAESAPDTSSTPNPDNQDATDNG